MLQQPAQQFQLDSPPVSCERYGSGHINETYLVKTKKGTPYILQKINHQVFRDVPKLMQNIAAVTRFLARGQNDPRRVLTLVPTLDGQDFLTLQPEAYWRTYVFVQDSICLDAAQTPEDFYQSGVAFGGFQKDLATFPAQSLHETIPHFHDTPARYAALIDAIKHDKLGRAAAVAREVDFALERKSQAGQMTGMLKGGKLPLRVTHNDTKLNNVMLDAQTRKALCVIDLDTVMPGLAGNDFGDSIRFGAATAREDEKNLDQVRMSLPLYEAYARGFLGACGQDLTANEKETLPWGAKLMTLECGVRFLTDYLQGDTYFHTRYEGQNLDRCRTQLKLVADMENKWDAMRKLIREVAT